jgi:hypothetical protein
MGQGSAALRIRRHRQLLIGRGDNQLRAFEEFMNVVSPDGSRFPVVKR